MENGYVYGTKTVNDLVLLAKNKQLNLNPAFQRQSVWSLADRKKLVESLLDERPIPSVFLYEAGIGPRGRTVYAVIDGKQRIETLFMFMGVNGFSDEDAFSVRPDPENRRVAGQYWWELTREQQNRILNTRLQVVEIAWPLSDVIDLFVRINSTGKRLTGAEQRNARWIDNPVLREAKRLAEEYEPFFTQNKVFTAGQLRRMKHVEFTAELLVSFAKGAPVDKKPELDRLVEGKTIDGETLRWAASELRKAFNRIHAMFPKLASTRLHTSTELYTLVMLIHDYQQYGYSLTNARRNAIAQQLLIQFGQGVDLVNANTHLGKGIRPDQAVYMDYLNTVRSDTDSAKQRRKRARMLDELLSGVFETKASSRLFSPLQRRILWHSLKVKKCAAPGCTITLTWNDFTVDHIKPHSKGGQTDLSNAQLMCRTHNSAKGARWA